MPLYSYQCKGCGDQFETLVRGDDVPVCPSCGSADLDRLMSSAAIGGKTEAMMSKVRAKAQAEGHFSNFSKSELKRR